MALYAVKADFRTGLNGREKKYTHKRTHIDTPKNSQKQTNKQTMCQMLDTGRDKDIKK